MPARRRRGGRPRKAGQRYPNGALHHRKVGPTDELIARRAEAVGVRNAREQAAGWLPGQLYLRGDISEAQLEAARRWHGVGIAYKRLLEGQRPIKAVTLDMPSGGPPVDDPDAYARTKARYDLYFDAIASRGRHVLRACVDAVFHNRVSDPALVREGLEALRVRLGL